MPWPATKDKYLLSLIVNPISRNRSKSLGRNQLVTPRTCLVSRPKALPDQQPARHSKGPGTGGRGGRCIHPHFRHTGRYVHPSFRRGGRPDVNIHSLNTADRRTHKKAPSRPHLPYQGRHPRRRDSPRNTRRLRGTSRTISRFLARSLLPESARKNGKRTTLATRPALGSTKEGAEDATRARKEKRSGRRAPFAHIPPRKQHLPTFHLASNIRPHSTSQATFAHIPPRKQQQSQSPAPTLPCHRKGQTPHGTRLPSKYGTLS
jgi:hypothetical protein